MTEFIPPISSRDTKELIAIANSTNGDWQQLAIDQAKEELKKRHIGQAQQQKISAKWKEEEQYLESEYQKQLKRNETEGYSTGKMFHVFFASPFIFSGKCTVELSLSELKKENYQKKFRQRLILLISGLIFYALVFVFFASILKKRRLAAFANVPEQSIFLFKDTDGLYLYDPGTNKEKVIFKLNDAEIFLEEPCQFRNDTLIVGLKGKKYIHDGFIKDYFSLDTKTGRKWLSQKVIYGRYYKEEYKLKIKTLSFDTSGDSTIMSDTTMPWHSSESSWKGQVFNDLHPRFYSEQIVGNKKIFSLRGSLYLAENLDTTLILEFKGDFDPKFGCGYLQPQIDPKGNYAIYTFTPELLHIFQSSSLRKIDLKTKKTEILKYGEFGSPTFSSDGKFILFSRDHKENKLKVWSSDIYILDLATLTEKKISNAYSAQWKKENGL